ncbi:putative phage tail protein [Megasphaera vaginalis (ex Srinivasan et al. 2021)]|uniref:PF10076 family protein n=1 Tax=Megasphaera vaginalis (ex Srinivasan et al. 2021) TaxID=1111454 RepID=U7UIV1_9FIRM|nr:putative phage tail protein [Megasphaera vaginalis (ex Srinivasan et al. 2021)]ERT59347.1 PF10076 family protein [Megasphaera vaginalis (ex Srinivasan et al. 2021)]
MPNFNLLRTETVDISRYLPAFVKKDPTMMILLDTYSWEHEKMRLVIVDVLQQFFVETATWGLGLWERYLGIAINDDDTIGIRRDRIMLKLCGTGTSTLSAMEKIVNTYGSGYIVEYNNQYYFNIYISTNKKRDLQEMRRQIMLYKPAHLGVSIYLGYSWDGRISFDGMYKYWSETVEWSDE